MTSEVTPGDLALTTTVRDEPTAASAILGSAIATVRTSSVELTTSARPTGIRSRSRFWAWAGNASHAAPRSATPQTTALLIFLENILSSWLGNAVEAVRSVGGA